MKKAHLIGIGGIGMSALANLLLAGGVKISGSDAGGPSELTKDLEQRGAKIFYQHKENNIKDGIDLVIYSEAISGDNPEMTRAKALEIERKSYAAALGELAADYNLILVTGTHGKTTITGMISHMALEQRLDPTIVIGSKMKELDNKNYRIGRSNLFIAEGCEYRRSFLNFKPKILVISNIEVDHLDYFKDETDYLNAFKEIIGKVPQEGGIIINGNDKKALELTKNASCQIINIDEEEADKVKLKIPGKHNRINALMALAAIKLLGADGSESIKSFTGTWRRLELIGTNKGALIYDDYAHHPTEIKATLQALREKYPKEKICAVFQPHQVSRTKEFENEFASAFKMADKVVLSDIYAVRDSEEDSKNTSTEFLAHKIRENGTSASYEGDLERTKEHLKKHLSDWDVVILMGAGNITKIREALLD